MRIKILRRSRGLGWQYICMFGFGKPQSYLGVDLGAGGVKLVELRNEKKRPVLFTYGFTRASNDIHQLLFKQESSLPENTTFKPVDATAVAAPVVKVDQERIAEYAAMIKAVCKEAKTQSKVAVASLPVSSVFHAIVTLPIVKREEFDRILKAEIKKLLPYPLEEMVIDSQILPSPPESRNQRVLVNAVPRAIVVFYTKVFQQAGLTLDSLEPESIALARSLVGRDTATGVLVDIGAERTNFFIVDQAVPVTHHSIERGGDKMNAIVAAGLGIPVDYTSEQMKHDVFSYLLAHPNETPIGKAQFTEMFYSIIDPILKEIDYSLELYLRQTANLNKRPEKVVLTGGSAIMPFLAEAIAEKFKIKCFIGDPWGRVVYQDSLRPILQSVGPRMSVAIGLALRNMV